jgi:hypothetical protein
MFGSCCIQLILSGSATTTEPADPYRRSSKEVEKKLKAQRNRGIDHHEGSARDSGAGGM